LLSVAVDHGYNLSGVCPCLKFYPTENTEAVLEQAGLLYKPSLDGVQIFYDNDRLEALELCTQDPEKNPSFDFKVYAQDPEFRSYSEPFARDEQGILYFDNLEVSDPGKQVLSIQEFVTVEDFKPDGAPEFEDVLSQKDRLRPPEFVLRIYANNKKGALLQQWLEPEPTIYRLRFNSRQRYWKYYLLGKIVSKNKNHKGFYIVDPDNQVEFETTGEEMLSDRSIAYTFRSKQQIPLNEHYPFRFQLKQKGQAGETVVIPRLPVANIKQVGMEAVAEQETIVSEIYINS